MTALSTTSFDKMLKIWYDARRVKLRAYKRNPLLALMPKAEDFKGKQRTIPMWYGVGQGVSATFSEALANKGNGQYANWDLTRVKGYGLGSIENEVLEASRGDKAAFMQATSEIDGVFHQVTRDLAIALYRDRNGARGRIGSLENGDGTGDVVRLATRSDVTNFEVGMWLYSSQLGTSATLEGSPTAMVIRKIDRQAGDLYMGSAVGGAAVTVTSVWSTAAATWYLHRSGDITGASETLKIAGLDAWIPSTAPGATAFFGVDRSVDTERLGGVRVDGSSMTVEDALQEGAAALHEVGAAPNKVFINPMKYKTLIRELGSRVEHDIVRSPDMAKIGFKSVKLYTAAGEMDVVPDASCPFAQAWMLEMDTWKLFTLGGAPRMLTYGPGDGNRWLRESAEDAVEYRVGWYGQLGCYAPGHNCRITLAS